MNHVIASNKHWHKNVIAGLKSKTSDEFSFISSKEELLFDHLQSIKPRFIFFPHWSDLIPAEIYENYECVIFHMTDLPFGRGGSPLQNLIVRGLTTTKLSALKCVKQLDAGPVYLKRDLSLYGNAEEIYLRASCIIEDMIITIIGNNAAPVPQEGEPVIFKRRTPSHSNMKGIDNLSTLFDQIRMLDADGYPPAFIETDEFVFKFKRAALKYDRIEADVIIERKKDEE